MIPVETLNIHLKLSLDALGRVLGLARGHGEGDDPYRRRLVASVQCQGPRMEAVGFYVTDTGVRIDAHWEPVTVTLCATEILRIKPGPCAEGSEVLSSES